MSRLIQGYKDEKVRHYGNDIVDTETGELINIGNSTLLKRTSTNEITINSKEYVYVDVQTLMKLLKKGVKQVDLALLLSLSSNLLIKYNICLNDDDEPLKTSTIAVLINNKPQSTKRKINRLIKHGLLYYGVYKQNKRLGKVYIINPYFIRKGRKLSGGLRFLFQDIE